MATIVGILTFISMINTTSERLKARNFFICQYFSFYEQLKFCAQLSWAWKKFYILRAWPNLGPYCLQRLSADHEGRELIIWPSWSHDDHMMNLAGTPCYHTSLIDHFTLRLLVSSADNLCKQFGPRSGLTNCQAWSGSKLFDILMLFLKEFFEKSNFEK